MSFRSSVSFKAGKVGRRGTPRRLASAPAGTPKIVKFFGIDKKEKRIRDDGSDEEAEACKSRKVEYKLYMNAARKLHKAGHIKTLDPGPGGSMGQARCIEKAKLADLIDQECEYIEERTERIRSGEGDYTQADLAIDTAMFKAKKQECIKNLAVLGDRTLETTLVDSTIDSSVDTSNDPEETLTDDVFTEVEDEVQIEYED